MQIIYFPNSMGAYGDHPVYPSGYNWQAVDDDPADDDTSYIYAPHPNPAGYTTLGFADPAERGIINFITLYVRGKQIRGSAFDGNWYPAIYTPGQSPRTYGGDSTWGSYHYQSQTLSTNPWTGLAWTWADLNALQIGVYMGVYGSGSSIRVTQIYVVIDYTPIASGQHRLIGGAL